MVDSTMDTRARRSVTPGVDRSIRRIRIDRSFISHKTAGMIPEIDFTASVGFTRRLRLSQVTVRSLGSRGRPGPSPAGQPVSAQSLTRKAALDSVELLGTSDPAHPACQWALAVRGDIMMELRSGSKPGPSHCQWSKPRKP
jgi:hypothetical protein